MLRDSGFTGVLAGDPVDTFGGATGEAKARAFEVYGYAFSPRRPAWHPRTCSPLLPSASMASLGYRNLTGADLG
jgi:hypothetical protein